MTSYVRTRRAKIKRDRFRSQAEFVARWLAVLGNGKRLLTTIHLIDGERTVSDLADLLGLSHSAMCQHLSLLVEQGIVECRAEGVWRYYSCKSGEAKELIKLLDDLIRDQLLPEPLEGSLQRP